MPHRTEPADVAVVIPVKDRADQLRAALESVRHQSQQPREVIVIDDGSSDGTMAVAREFDCRVLRNEVPKGAAAARNRGIDEARSNVIAFLDSDDEWFPDHLARSLQFMGDNIFVTSPMIDSLGRARGNLSRRIRPINHRSFFFPENIVCTSTVLAQKKALVSAGGFHTFDRAEDLDLWIRLLAVGPGIALAIPTARYFVPASYADASLATRNRFGTLAVMDRYAAEPWLDSSILRLVRTQQSWDDLRHGLRNQGLRGAAAVTKDVLIQGLAPAGLWGTFRHRYRARHFAAKLGLSSDMSASSSRQGFC